MHESFCTQMFVLDRELQTQINFFFFHFGFVTVDDDALNDEKQYLGFLTSKI